MKKAVMRGCILVLCVSLIICGISSAVIFNIQATGSVRDDMSLMAQVAAEYFDPDEDHNQQANRFAQAAQGLRVTIIAADGTVTGDSEADFRQMENHAGRAEIMEALGTKTAVSVRSSETLGRQLMYAVSRTSGGYYIRIAREFDGLLSNFFSFLPAVAFAAALSLVISLVFASRFSRSVSHPIIALNDSLTGVKDGSTILNPENYPYVELRDMASKINGLSYDISTHIRAIQEEKEKIDYILDNMDEGFLLLDDQQNVLIINNSACRHLGCGKSVVGKNVFYATRDMKFIHSLNQCLETGSEVVEDLSKGQSFIEARFTVVRQNHQEINGGLIVIMTDVTANRKAVHMRRDFFSNASHELNTPITSIKGFSELLQAGVPMSSEQQKEIVDRIVLETDRMSRLIGDIITISRLESSALTYEPELVNLDDVILECCDEVKGLAQQNNVAVKPELTPVTLIANRRDLKSLVGNLLGNAVKYNIPCGSVDISLTQHSGQATLIVRNDGEPIPEEHRDRVFERFYRIDKGRSKDVGGTGLGLSIAKHVVERLGGSITLHASHQAGNTFTVTLPATAKKGTEPQEKTPETAE